MKLNRKIFTLLLGMCCIALLPLFFAFENSGRLKIKGKIADEAGKPLTEVDVVLKEFNKVVSSTTTSATGKFTVEIEYQKKQTLHFSKKGFASMYLQIVSDIPLPKSDKNFTFTTEFPLIANNSEFNVTQMSNRPFSRVVYDPLEDLFILDDSVLDEFVAKSNEPEGVTFKGTLLVNDSTQIDSATLNIYEGKVLTETIAVDSTGLYEFKVFHNREAKVEVISPNYYPTYFMVNTQIADSLADAEYQIAPKIELISKKTEYINPMAFQMPVTEFVFSPDSVNFTANSIVNQQFTEVLDEPKKLPIQITGIAIDSSGKPINNIDVIIKEGDKLIAANRTTKDGSYSLKAPYDKDLTLEFSGNDYHKVIMDVNTERVNKDNFKKMTINPPPAKIFAVNNAFVAPEVFEQPMAFIQLADSAGDFEEDTLVRVQFEEKLKQTIEKNKPVVALAEEVYPENFGYFYIDGKVGSINGNKLDSTKVKVYVGNVLVQEKTSDKKGIFTLELEYNKQFNVIVSRRGYHTMKFELDATIPQKIATKDNNHKMDIPMIPLDLEGINTTAFEMDFTRIYYDTLAGESVDDDMVLTAFRNRLNTPEKDLLPKKLIVNTTIQDFSRRTHKDVVMYVKENETVVDTIPVDRNGNFTAELDYKKNYNLQLEGDQFFTSFIEVNTNINGVAEIDTTSLQPIPLYFKDDPNIVDPLIFQNPIAKLSYQNEAGNFAEELSIPEQFKQSIEEAKILAEIASKRLTIQGVVKDFSEKRIKGAKVYVVENFNKIDSTETDRRGNYSIQLPFQKNLKLQFVAPNFYETFASVDSKLPQDSIRDFTISLSLVTLIPNPTEDIDITAFGLPIQKVYYLLNNNNFVEDTLVNKQFFDKLWEPKREKERLLAEEKAKDAAQKIQTTPATTKSLGVLSTQKLDMAPTVAMPPPENLNNTYFDNKEALSQKEKDESIAEKSAEAEAFLLSILEEDTLPAIESIADAQVESEAIDDFEFVDFELPEVEEVSEDLMKQQEELMAFNEYIASNFLQRGMSIDSISYDSTYKVKRPVRVYQSTSGLREDGQFEIFATLRTKIVEGDSIIDMVHKVNWFGVAPDDFYVNTKKVSRKQFIAILENYNLNTTLQN